VVLTGMKEDWLATCTWLGVLKYNWTEGRQEVWRLEEKLKARMLFVTNSVQLVQWMPYQWSSGRVWRLQNRQANHSHCEICKWPCVTGYGRKGATWHDWLINWNWRMLWNGNECEKNKSNENFKTTIPSKNYDTQKITSVWNLLNIWVAF